MNTRKSARQTFFDNHYGNSIRTALRELEEVAGKLRAYSFPSKALQDLKKEIPGVQADIEDKAFRTGNLLAEIDASKSHKCKGWSESFNREVEMAGLKLESSANAAVTSEIQFRQRVEAARDLYRAAIVNARAKLEAIRKKA